MTDFSEPELIIPSLELLSETKGGLTTSELIIRLRALLQPTQPDTDRLRGRNDDKFSQRVRNLTGSHRTLEKKQLAEVVHRKYVITNAGLNYLIENKPLVSALVVQGFSRRAKEAVSRDNFRNVVIEEGQEQQVSRRVRKRSQVLNQYARDHFKGADGSISCHGCGFEGAASYGPEGNGLIEIHHLKPLSLLEGKVENKSLKDALKEVAPLCPNCHRMVHRRPDKLLSLFDLKRLVNAVQKL